MAEIVPIISFELNPVSAFEDFEFVFEASRGRLGVAKMKGISSMTALLLGALLAWTGSGCSAEEPPANDGRVPLIMRAGDPDGGALKFNWTQIEGPPVTIADPNAAEFDKVNNKWVSRTYFIPKEPGKYVFECAVTNEAGDAAKRTFVQEVLRAVPAPQADAGPDQKKKVGESVLLSGMNSKAFDGRTVTQYQWSVKQAPPGFSLDESKLSGRQVDFKVTLPGKYIFELKVFDSKRWGEPAVVEVDVKKPAEIQFQDPPTPAPVELQSVVSNGNLPLRPRPDAGEGKNNIRVGEKIVLDGSASKVDPREKPRFVWIQKDTERSPFVRQTPPDTTRPFDRNRNDDGNFPVQTFIADAPGIYKFVLQITTEGSPQPVESAEVINTVLADATGNPPDTNAAKKPVPVVTYAPSSVEVNEEVRIDASKSTSPSGAQLTFQWMQVPLKKFPNIRGENGPIIRVSGSEPGEYWIQPVVSDGKDFVKADPITFKVTAAAMPPLIETERTRQCNVKDEIVLKAKITDPAGLPFEIKWSCIDPPIPIPEKFATQPQFRFQPNRAATYLFRIEATNSKGLKSMVDVQVGVKDPGQLAPSALLDGPERATVGETITISAARSVDPGKNPLSFKWTDDSEGGPKIQGPAPARNRSEWRFTPTEAGRIVVTLVVNNGTADSAPAKWPIDVAPKNVVIPDKQPDNTVVIPPPAAKPVARISGPKSAPVRTEVELSGETSSSSDGGPLVYSWSQLLQNGAADVGLLPSQSRGKTLRFTPLQPGAYTFTLEVRDQTRRSSDTASYTLEILNGGSGQPPPPAAPPRALVTLLSRDPLLAGKEIRMTARGSVDPSGGTLSYKWVQIKGPQPLPLVKDNSEEIWVTPLKPGAYEFELIITGAAGIPSAPTTLSFVVTAPVAAVKAVIAPVGEVMAGDRVVLDGTNSSSQNGGQLQFQWRQIEGGPPVKLQVGDDQKPKFEFIVPADGKYTFELRVSDGNDSSPPAVLEFNVKPRGKNSPPIAVVDKSAINVEVGLETVIDASASNDPDNGPEPLSYRWKRDGAVMKSVTGPINKFTPPTAGKMSITVEAFDGKEFSEPATVQVNVMAPGSLPVAIATVNPNPSKKSVRGANQALKNLIVLDGTKSTPEDKIATYTWTQTSGDNLGLKAEQLSKEKVGLYIFKAGKYSFQLVVSDGANSSKAATVDVQVDDE